MWQQLDEVKKSWKVIVKSKDLKLVECIWLLVSLQDNPINKNEIIRQIKEKVNISTEIERDQKVFQFRNKSFQSDKETRRLMSLSQNVSRTALEKYLHRKSILK